LGRGDSGASNWNSVGVETAYQNLAAAIQAAVAASGATLADVVAIGVGMSGVDRPDDRARVQAWLDNLLPQRTHVIENDAVVALAAGTGGRRFGVVIVSGTGMIALGFNAAGERARAGGWGALLGDGGSGYAIGAAILRAATWAADGRGPQTALLPALLEHLQLARPEQLIRWAYDDIAWHRFAELAPLAYAAAGHDPVAAGIVAQAAADLGIAVETVAAALGLSETPFPLVMAGGNLRALSGRGPLAEALTARLARSLPVCRPIYPTLEPVMGAALLALHAHRGVIV
jgi:N-acetylglucosamine kinase